MKLNLSVIIPAYNEEKRLEKTLIKIKNYFKNKKIKYEIIVIDDGSLDMTSEIALKHNSVLIKNKKNYGKGYSIKKGFFKAKYNYILFTDSDLSTPIEEFDKFLPFINYYDIIIGSRRAKNSKVVQKQNIFRIIAGNIFPIIVSIIMHLGIKDTQCGFKLFNKKKCYKIFKKLTINRFSFDVELIYLAKKYNLKIKEIGINWFNDSHSKVKFFKDSFIMLKDIIKIKLNDILGKY
ncbi:MAG: glycosyltransferase family 2 protein [Candidatus Woesearchaeota archaeon]